MSTPDAISRRQRFGRFPSEERQRQPTGSETLKLNRFYKRAVREVLQLDPKSTLSTTEARCLEFALRLREKVPATKIIRVRMKAPQGLRERGMMVLEHVHLEGGNVRHPIIIDSSWRQWVISPPAEPRVFVGSVRDFLELLRRCGPLQYEARFPDIRPAPEEILALYGFGPAAGARENITENPLD